MKTILIALFISIANLSSSNYQETIVMTGTFEQYQNEVYIFTDGNGNSFEFEKIAEQALAAYDLKSSEFNGQLFQVSFTIEEDEEDETIEIYSIESLKRLE
jgi:hypothetical protein